MTPPKKQKGYKAMASELPQEMRTREQKEHDDVSRHELMLALLDQASSAVDLVTLVDILGLDEELAELVGDIPERHRRLRSARIQAGLEDAVLE
jgi:hypothetical protein